jgi:N6-L-threonylcarbamoyladenine synthase
MKILSIETSCDDTGITIMEATGGTKNASFKILADASNSQISCHIPFGGVYPALAKKEHAKNLPILFEQVMAESKTS